MNNISFENEKKFQDLKIQKEIFKKSDFNLTLMEYIFPKICFHKFNKNINYFTKICNYFKDKLSIEKLLKASIKNDMFRKIILNEEELEVFNNIPKVKLKTLEKINPIRDYNFDLSFYINYKKIEKNDRINKIIECFN